MSNEQAALDIVSNFLEASMKPDPETAAGFMANNCRITFTGNRIMADAAAITAFNANRYSWVKKALGQFDVVGKDGFVVVYSNGTLYGEWPDGKAFEGNRYLDRFEVREGKITRMDVWNDSAAWILDPSAQ